MLVSGAPGAGKSTLAGPLSRELGLPLIAKDVIKERLVATLPYPAAAERDPAAWSRLVGEATMEVLWALASQPVTVMLEANFRPRSSLERERLTALGSGRHRGQLLVPPGAGGRTVRQKGRVTALVMRVPTSSPSSPTRCSPSSTHRWVWASSSRSTPQGPVDVRLVAGQVRGLLACADGSRFAAG